jgi:hypothetical protein
LRLGGHHFSRDLRPLDADGNEISMWSADAQNNDSDDEDDSEEDSEEESSEEDSDDAGPAKPAAELTREERKKQKAAQKAAAVAKKNKGVVQVGDLPSDSEEDSDDDMPANPNHSKAARNMTKAPAQDVDEVAEGVKKLTTSTAGMSRKERESMEAQQAKERYRKLHEAGKTDEAKADLARLKLIREKREAEAARKQVRSSFSALGLTAVLILILRCRPKRKREMLRKLPEGRRLRPRRPRNERPPWVNPVPRRARVNEPDCRQFHFVQPMYCRFVFVSDIISARSESALVGTIINTDYDGLLHVRWWL